MLLQCVALLYFLVFKWMRTMHPLKLIAKTRVLDFGGETKALNPRFAAETLYVSLFVGICFFKQVHSQFCCWYWFSLSFLFESADVNLYLRCVLLMVLGMIYDDGRAKTMHGVAYNLFHFYLLYKLARARKQVDIYTSDNSTHIISKQQ